MFHSGHADKKVHGTRNINALPNDSLDTKSPAQCNDLDALLGGALTGEITTEYAIAQMVSFLSANARRAHPKRDQGSLSMRFGLFQAELIDEVINI